jgi:hypothetical protein
MQNNRQRKQSAKRLLNGGNIIVQSPGQASEGPGAFQPNIRYNHKFRFRATADFSSYVTDSHLLAVAGTVCTVTNSTASVLARAVRISNVKLWSPPAYQGETATVSLTWFGALNSPNLEVSDTTSSVTKNAYISVRPPKNSLASFWQKNTATTLFNMVCPINTILEISLEIIQSDQETSVQTTTYTTCTAGQIYYPALSHGVSDLLVPIGLQTTT